MYINKSRQCVILLDYNDKFSIFYKLDLLNKLKFSIKYKLKSNNAKSIVQTKIYSIKK